MFARENREIPTPADLQRQEEYEVQREQARLTAQWVDILKDVMSGATSTGAWEYVTEHMQDHEYRSAEVEGIINEILRERGWSAKLSQDDQGGWLLDVNPREDDFLL